MGSEAKPAIVAVKDLFAKSLNGLREFVRVVMQGDAESRDDGGGRSREGRRIAAQLDYRSGYYTRALVTLVGKLELRVIQDRNRRFSTEPGL